jgi:hypothetical protein
VSTPVIVMLIILVILIAACIALYFFGKKAEKRQAEQEEQMASVAQTMSMLIIDKKRMKEAGLPAVVIENTPKYLRRTKVPVVKAKVGPKVMTLMCDAKVFEVLPVKKEAKVVVSGIYITGIKSVRGGSIQAPVKKKKGLLSRFKKD